MSSSCEYCKKAGANFVCGGCHNARYCNEVCQSAHWIGSHHRVCNSAGEEMDIGLRLTKEKMEGRVRLTTHQEEKLKRFVLNKAALEGVDIWGVEYSVKPHEGEKYVRIGPDGIYVTIYTGSDKKLRKLVTRACQRELSDITDHPQRGHDFILHNIAREKKERQKTPIVPPPQPTPPAPAPQPVADIPMPSPSSPTKEEPKVQWIQLRGIHISKTSEPNPGYVNKSFYAQFSREAAGEKYTKSNYVSDMYQTIEVEGQTLVGPPTHTQVMYDEITHVAFLLTPEGKNVDPLVMFEIVKVLPPGVAPPFARPEQIPSFSSPDVPRSSSSSTPAPPPQPQTPTPPLPVARLSGLRSCPPDLIDQEAPPVWVDLEVRGGWIDPIEQDADSGRLHLAPYEYSERYDTTALHEIITETALKENYEMAVSGDWIVVGPPPTSPGLQALNTKQLEFVKIRHAYQVATRERNLLGERAVGADAITPLLREGREKLWSVIGEITGERHGTLAITHWREPLAYVPAASYHVNMRVRINISRLNHLVYHGRVIPFRHKLFEYVQKVAAARPLIDIFSENNSPLATVVPRSQPAGIKTPLYHHQLDAVQWMHNLEDHIEAGWSFPDVSSIPRDPTPSDRKVTIDTEAGLFILPWELARGDTRQGTFWAKGGIYADPPGSGKTLSMICLIKEHSIDLDVIRRNPRHGNNVNSRATLVLCPAQIVMQWHAQFVTHTDPMPVVITITTNANIKHLTYNDLVTADVVVVSTEFLFNNDKYAAHARFPENIGIDRLHDTKVMAQELWRKAKPLAVKYPLIEHIHWHRVVIDEGHKIADVAGMTWHILRSITSTYSWYMTGTPKLGDDYKAMRTGTLSFLGFRAAYHVGDTTNAFTAETKIAAYRTAVMEQLHHTIFWKNERTQEELRKIPPAVEEIINVDLTPIERGLYDDQIRRGNMEDALEICSHPQITDEARRIYGDGTLTLEEVRKRLVDDRREVLKRATEEAARLRAIRTTLEEEFEAADEIGKEARRFAVEQTRTDHETALATMRAAQSTITYMTEAIPRIEEERARNALECIICMEPMTQMAVLPCGHHLCRKCSRTTLGEPPRCPMCRTAVPAGSILDVKAGTMSEEEELRYRIGAKMSALLIYIRTHVMSTPAGRVIIFSKRNRLLHRVGDLLEANRVHVGYIQGPAATRAKAITEFNEGKSHAILLSLEHAAEGVNLTAASHVIFLEPPDADVRRAGSEEQASARAIRIGQTKPVIIARFVARDTIEADVHEAFLRSRHPGAAAAAATPPEPEIAAAAAAAASSQSQADV
jgi:SNF2 family DNA or RNA helicase